MIIQKLKLTSLVPDNGQPRKSFEDIGELLNSILKEGLLEPLKVRKNGAKYIIVDGERRYRALTKLLEKDNYYNLIDCIIISPKEVFLTQLSGDLHKNKLTQYEEAEAFKKALGEGLSVEELKMRLGIKQSRITGRLKLLNLSERTKKLILDGDLPPSIIEGIDFDKFKENEQTIISRINKESFFGITKNRKRDLIKKIIKEEVGKKDAVINSFVRGCEDFRFFLSDYILKISKYSYEKEELEKEIGKPIRDIKKRIEESIKSLENVLISKKSLEITRGKISLIIEKYGQAIDLSKEMLGRVDQE